MQTYDSRGHLFPYELLPIDVLALYTDFVAVYPNSATRSNLYEGYCAYNIVRQ